MRPILRAVLAILLLNSGWVFPQPAPAATSNIDIPGLHRPVEVIRDKWGVAHIYAKDQHDLFFAQGYVAAQDRLFQMELWKRVGQGRLAEVLGKDFIARDRAARMVRYRGNMEAEFSSYAPDAKQILSAFTDGINAYIRSVISSTDRLPVEFRLAGFMPKMWKPEDCLSRMAAHAVTTNAEDELINAQMVHELGREVAEKILYIDPPVPLAPPEGVDYSGLSSALVANFVGSDRRIGIPRNAIGSNNWTISGKLTSTGKPMLANDPHRSMAVPALRYLVHLVAPGWNVIGAGEPALPGVAIGHNERIAWGLTIFGADQQDLYLEEMNPADPLEYKTEAGWQKVRIERETIRVKDAHAEEIEVKFTRHGPLIWEDAKTRRALAMRWVGAEPGTAGYLASLAVDRAKDWNEFRSAMRRWKLPPENMVYADRSGNIGEISGALVPIRRKGNGLLPVPGTGGYEWGGFVPFEKLPQHFNPASGYFATANHKMIPDDYPYPVGYDWSEFRIRRIHEVMNDKERTAKLSIRDMMQMQNDVMSIPARELIALLAASDDENVKLLKGWDCVLDRNSPAAALYEVWYRRLGAAVLQVIAPGTKSSMLDSLGASRLVRFLTQSTNRESIMLAELSKAAAELTELQGPDRTKWKWGVLHQIHFQHGIGQFGIPPAARSGDTETVNSTGMNRSTGYTQTTGASFRELIDLSDWDKSLAINTPGQSGDPENSHFADLYPLWLEGEYFPLVFSRTAIEAVAEQTITLTPTRTNHP